MAEPLLERNNRDNSVWIPDNPLGDMLMTNYLCGDIDSISDNTLQPDSPAWCWNPLSQTYELYTSYQAKPEFSEFAFMIPGNSAAFLEQLARYNCPFPTQIRGYCGSPAADQNGWTSLLHLRRAKLNTATLANPTAINPEKDPGTPMLTRNAQFLGPWMQGSKAQPGFFAFANTRTAVSLVYADAPSCGVCDGLLSDGCQTLFLLGQITVGTLADLRYSTNGGTSFTTVTLSGAIASETLPRDIIDFNGRLILTIGDTIYYNDTPTIGSTWTEATITASVAVTTTGKLATNGSYLYAIYNTSGVLRSADGAVWEEVTAGITAEVQNQIDAAGDVVVTVGANDSIQISTSAGAKNTWSSLATGPGGATDDATDVSVSLRDATLSKSAVIWVSQVTGALTTIYKSNDLGVTWSSEKVIPTVETGLQLESAVDGDWIWANYDAVTIKNHNRGYGLDWLTVSNAGVGANFTRFTICPYNPNTAFVATNLT